ncbi:UDP-2,4-diacetamido-2,4,6-trideoxy-beta-L-altropyranose hydrolase [Glaciecola siphonariae]|uniref:UDP-2,4-diacetamido-2,4, 6-trideoxy-beta-L-altropyranose hydrolase n=1 Tax=Glaciecola siphonariae TaxID=521012 RepID=A0ABV9LVJ7_9ALTE
MNVLFRVDAALEIGSGHVMRCLTLARALKSASINCEFLCRQTTGDLIAFIRQQGFVVHSLSPALNKHANDFDTTSIQSLDAQQSLKVISQDYELLIVDHYELGAEYCAMLRKRCRSIMVIDDLADREHDCDLLLDQNLFHALEKRYAGLLQEHCTRLLGPKFALLRPEFYQATHKKIDGRILVGFGSSDPHNLSAIALEAIARLDCKALSVDLVIGDNYPWREALENKVKQQQNVALHVQTPHMAKLMCQAQFMLGAGGTTHWERCICALPALVVTCADNQIASTEYLTQLNACVYLGRAEEASVQMLEKNISRYLSQPDLLDTVANAARNIVPKDAGTPLVVEHVCNLLGIKGTGKKRQGEPDVYSQPLNQRGETISNE